MKRLTRRDFLRQSGAMVLLSSAMPRIVQADQCKLPVLLYHDIAEQFHDEYTIAPSLFAAQMEMLYTHGYKAVLLNELSVRDEECERKVVLTFDDGYASFLDYCFPLLKEYGFKTTINVIGQLMGTSVIWGGSRPILSWDECRFLKESGLVDFGCHTYGLHRPGSTSQELERNLHSDLIRFSEVFSAEMGAETDILAWPYGIYDRKAVRTAQQLGFKYFLTSNKKLFIPDGSYEEIPRLNVGNKHNLAAFQRYIGGV
jgi:peptidoglycan/xylan/chitin deacetylase (PgdA/CDA1 family)